MGSLDNITVVLIAQHRVLQKCLGETKDLSLVATPATELMTGNLKSFTTTLFMHMHLEEEVFYPELLERMKDRGSDISKTVEFIDEMKKIGAVVVIFLAKYDSPLKLKEGLNDFIQDLDNVIELMNIRMESEESGVYCYWDALQGVR